MHPHHHGPGRHIFSYLIRFAANPRGLDKGRSVQGVDEERHPYPPAAARRSETTVKYIVIVQSSFSFTSTAHFSPYRAGLLLLLLHSWFSAGWSTQASSPFPSVPPLASWWASTCIGMLPGKHRCSTWFRAVAPAATSTTAAVASRTMASLRPSTARKTAPSRPRPRACNIHVRCFALLSSTMSCIFRCSRLTLHAVNPNQWGWNVGDPGLLCMNVCVPQLLFHSSGARSSTNLPKRSPRSITTRMPPKAPRQSSPSRGNTRLVQRPHRCTRFRTSRWITA